MELTHTFTVPVPPQQAFEVLQDIERIGPCMPGASIDSVDGRSFTGTVKVKIGPIKVTYQGEAEYSDVDAEAMAATITARGKESRGSGTANATVTADLKEAADGSEVHVVTDLAVTGRPAQFGRGVMEEVGQKLINEFAECLADRLGADTEAAPGTEAAPDTGTSPEPQPAATTPATTTPAAATAPTAARDDVTATEPQAIDLLDVAGGSLAKRLAPVLGAVAALWWWLRRRRRD